MRTFWVFVALAALSAQAAAQDEHHHHEGMKMGSPFDISAHAVALGTSTDISPDGRRLTEGYLTEPWVMAMYKAPGNVFTFNGMLNFEGLTIERGELSPGIWGEGYIDRRHPHTYLHEAVVSAQTPREVLGGTASLTFGKGFASFGTDDPMVRPFIKYPVNHHLAQILERVVLIGAIRRGPLTAEYSRFNGDEPQSPSDAPNLERFGDSWAVRATLHLNAAEIHRAWPVWFRPRMQAAAARINARSVLQLRSEASPALQSRHLSNFLRHIRLPQFQTAYSTRENITVRVRSGVYLPAFVSRQGMHIREWDVTELVRHIRLRPSGRARLG